MADGQTPHFSWILPENHINTNLWGGQNNANWQDADTKVYANQQAVAAIQGQTSTVTVNNVQVARTASVGATVVFANSTVSTGQQARWEWVGNTTTEAAGNVGTDLGLNAYSNTGSFLRTSIFITRSNGAMSFTGSASFSSTLTVSGGASIAGGLTTSSVSATQGAVTITAGSVSANPAVILKDSGGTTRANFYYLPGGDRVYMEHPVAGASLMLDAAADFVFTGSGAAFKAGGGSWTATSDARIKDVTGEYEAGLNEVLQLRPVTYRYKGNVSDQPGTPRRLATREFVGLVAQDVEGVLPGMVRKRKGYIDGRLVEDLRDLDSSELIYALVNSVRQLKAEVEALKAAR